MFLLRDIAPADLDDLQRAAVHLDSVNLPDDREALAAIIERSRASFAGELPVGDRCFVFVAADADSGEVVGTSMIFAQHGSRRAPHVFFDVLEEERYSETLDRHFAHRVLRIGYNYKGLTEVGGLVLRPEFRRHPERLGRQLASVRFLYLARHRNLFRDEVLSELMPPVEPDGTSLLWESLGRKFTGLSYQEADRLSQTNKEFIRSLFPQDPIYLTLLPAHVQALIGQVGPTPRGSRSCSWRSGSPSRIGSTRSTAVRIFTPRPTTSRWCGRRGWLRWWPPRRKGRRNRNRRTPRRRGCWSRGNSRRSPASSRCR